MVKAGINDDLKIRFWLNGSRPLMKSPRKPAAWGGHVALNSEKGILGQDIL